MITFNASSRIVLLGDVHGQWNRVQPIMDHEFPDGNGTALCVGDLVEYPRLNRGHHVYFTPGNHENFGLLERVRAGREALPCNYTPLFTGDVVEIAGLTVAGFHGVFSQHFADQRGEIPLKYFSREGAEKMRALPRPDILLMHEAPHGVGFRKNGEDYGRPLLTGLVSALAPTLTLFGHHHMTFEGLLGDSVILGLDYPRRSYGVLEYDAKHRVLRLFRRHAEIFRFSKNRQEHRYTAGSRVSRLFSPDLSLLR